MKNLLKLSLIFAAVLTFTSCEKSYTVTFNSQGGSAVASLTEVPEGTTIAEPVAPTKANSDFDGWYKEAACVTEWNFATDAVNSDITLYAKWSEASDKVGHYVTWYHGTSDVVGAHKFEMSLYDEGVFELKSDTLKFKTAGVVYRFYMYAPFANAASEQGYIIPEGEYKFDLDDTELPFTFCNRFSEVERAQNAQQPSWAHTADFTGGTVTVTKKNNGDYIVKAVVSDDMNNEYKLRYEGKIVGDSYDYRLEPLEKKTITENGVYTNIIGGVENNIDKVQAVFNLGGNKNLTLLFLLSPTDATTIPVGTYQIAKGNNIALPYVQASSGKTLTSPQYGTPSYITVDGSNVYFLQSGTVIVDASSITVTAKSYFGSTINMSYTGDLTILR
ncbi:MAG: InlB B-repeat-containing protein [Prevotellaceae bacterium]|nr:InlB B-repeat-containing protein [Prevotellaceae bacterium]